MEQDFGSPDKYKQKIIDGALAAHKAGTLALGAIPAVGPAIAAVAGPVLEKNMPEIGGAINSWLNLGDDRIGLTGPQWVVRGEC